MQVPNTIRRIATAFTYRDFRVMLEKQKDIDAVIVATPDHSHAVIAMAAMQLGKHVFVQKPLTRSLWEARMLTEAARKYKVVSQMGNQGHSGEGVRLIEEWIADGAIGKVREVHCWTNRPIWPQGMPRPADYPAVPDGLDWDLWIGPSPMRPYHPTYHPFSWRSWFDFGAGALGDMACQYRHPYPRELGRPDAIPRCGRRAFGSVPGPALARPSGAVRSRHLGARPALARRDAAAYSDIHVE